MSWPSASSCPQSRTTAPYSFAELCDVPKATPVCIGEACHDKLWLSDETLEWGEEALRYRGAATSSELYASSGGAFPTRTLVSPVVPTAQTQWRWSPSTPPQAVVAARHRAASGLRRVAQPRASQAT